MSIAGISSASAAYFQQLQSVTQAGTTTPATDLLQTGTTAATGTLSQTGPTQQASTGQQSGEVHHHHHHHGGGSGTSTAASGATQSGTGSPGTGGLLNTMA
jgi:hypothetical protein